MYWWIFYNELHNQAILGRFAYYRWKVLQKEMNYTSNPRRTVTTQVVQRDVYLWSGLQCPEFASLQQIHLHDDWLWQEMDYRAPTINRTQKSDVTANISTAITDVCYDKFILVSMHLLCRRDLLDNNCTCTSTSVSRVTIILNKGVTCLLESIFDIQSRR